MYRLYILLLLIIFSFFSCGKQQKQEKQLKEISFSPPVTIISSQPQITLLDTCPKPNIIVSPIKGLLNYTILTQNGLKEGSILPITKTPILEGEAGGYSFMQNFNTEQGLALSSIGCAYKDKAGNLWFGTSGGGVSRYNGESFTNFSVSQGLANNIVKCIIEDKKGNFWFGTNGGGVSKYDGRCFTNYTTVQGLANNIVLSITEDQSGILWFATNNGISKYDPTLNKKLDDKLFTNYTVDQGLLGNRVIVSFKDKKGNIWFGTENGISKYNSNVKEGPHVNCFTNYTTDQGLANNNVMSICEDHTGNIWFGTLNNGVSKFNPVKDGKGQKPFTNYGINEGLPQNCILSIIEDKRGDLWFGTPMGLSKYNPILKEESGSKLFTNFGIQQGLKNNDVSCIIEDKAGSLWIGSSAAGGLSKYDGKSFTSFTMDQGLVSDKIWSITGDKKGNLWFATSFGISKYDRSFFTNFRLGFISSSVRCIIEDKRGNIWFGSGYGVTKYDGKLFTNYSTFQGLPHPTVLSIAEDKFGNLWFGTYGGGVCKYDGNRVEAIERGEKISLDNQQDLKKINGKFVKSFTSFTTVQGLADNTVKCITSDRMGSMWFGTNGGGVSKYDGGSKSAFGRFTNYSRAQGLSHNTIYSILEDRAGSLWFGTAGGGVCKYNPSAMDSIGSKPFTTYTSANGLANDVVYAIVEDTLNDAIWFGTNLGLSGLKLNSLSNEVDGPKFENFNNKTGYPIKDVNTSALFLDKHGIVWAGTSDKLIRFDYSGINKSSEPPVVVIQRVKINGENITWYYLKPEDSFGIETKATDSLAILNEEITNNSRALTEVQREEMRKKFSNIKFDGITPFYPLPENLLLPFEHNNITFDFLAIETARPFMVNYQYKLEGYDKEWSPITDKTTASFGNMNEGEYVFKLKAQSPDGIWSEPVVYTFKVLPPWYRTWWMYGIYLVIGLSVIRLFFRWRTASLRKEKETLEQTVIVRTAEVVEQKELIEEKQKEIVDSINYAKRIQYTLLANDEMLQQNLKDHFVLFQPKDIVSGDFYWATLNKETGDKGQETRELQSSNTSASSRFYLAICDSTGHGVPGAFMSLLNISFLNEAITEKNIKQPNEILNYVRQRLIESVSQDGAQDGMDGILLCFENDKITYAAANNAPVIVRNNSVIDLPTDKMPIGKGEKDSSFALHTIETQKGDMLYFYTDGYADQFGGPKGKKFKYKPLENLLISIHQQPMEEQKQILLSTIENWRGNLQQVDDILVIGMRI